MKKFHLLLVSFSILVLNACSSAKTYVEVIPELRDQTNSIKVQTVVEQLILRFTPKGLAIEKSTATVRVLGSGVFVSRKGHILTCAHLFTVGVSSTIMVNLYNGKAEEAKLVYMDVDRDLALLKIKSRSYNYAKLTRGRLLAGQEVLAIGSPLSLEFSVTRGIISYVDRNLGDLFTYTQTDAPINSGNSGGPLFNLEGELVGINSAKMRDADGLGFAVSPKTIRDFLETVGLY
jgi:serine protease Do